MNTSVGSKHFQNMVKPPEFPASYRQFTMDYAKAGDVADLTAIVARVFDEYGWVFSAEEELLDFIRFEEYYGSTPGGPGRPRLFSIRMDSGRICGVIALKFNEEGACLSRVYIDDDLRGQGVGTWMITRVLDLAASEGIDHIHLWTDTQFTGAHRLYERLGFTMTRIIRSLHDRNHCFEWKMEMALRTSKAV